MPECIHELPEGTCSLCKPPAEGVHWDAKYEGVCAVATCTHRVINVGDRVKWNREGTHTIHASHTRD